MPLENRNDIYANALLVLAEASGRTAQIEKDLKAAASFIRNTPEVLKFISDGFVQGKGKEEAFDEILAGRVDPMLTLFMRILLTEDQLGNIESISSIFSELVAAKRSRISGQIVSAAPLPEHLVREIEVQTSRLLSKDVSLHPVTDPELLGGVLVKVGDFVIDGTIDTELENARQAILR